MTDHNYHTIDPLIMETLNLNERRMKRILDILHGNDPEPQYSLKREKQYKRKYEFIRKPTTDIRKNKRQQSFDSIPIKPRMSSVETLHNLSRINHKQKPQISPTRKAESHQRINTRVSAEQSLISKYQMDGNVQDMKSSIQVKHSGLRRNYGRSPKSKTKSLQINPKDIYRLEIEALVCKPTQIEDLESSQALMRRLKRRYQHLRKFDQHYYSKLNKNDFSLI